MPPQKPNDDKEALPWVVVYYLTPEHMVPALEFLDACPGTIDAQFTAVLDAVAAAPPPRFSGGGDRSYRRDAQALADRVFRP